LSGGELQRVALAAALVLRPRLVLLDEPTSQLDPVAGDELIWLLRRLNEEWGMAIVLAEHRLERCLAAADRVVAMAQGDVAFDGEPEAFLAWALAADEALATPGARLFHRAGIETLPRGVKAARQILARRGVHAVVGGDAHHGPAPKREASALRAAEAWVELDAGADSQAVLRGVDLRIDRGERVALMGRNGAGKTTLLRAAAGLVGVVSGRLEAPAGCALLPQSPADLMLRERVGDELPGEAGTRALEAVGLGQKLDSDPRDLSGGERQRLALAIVTAGRDGSEAPGLIGLDEPTRGMDRARKDELAAWIERLTRAGSAVVVATHDVEFAATFAERVVLLGDGVVIADGPPDEILSGGWYFATEVARILGVPGAISPERGAELILQAAAEAVQ
jgi:energy-coupling factor transport system ATP-binding protein